MKTPTAIVLAIVLISTLFATMAYAFEKSERAECIKWKQQAIDYPNFYLNTWQTEQCIAIEKKDRAKRFANYDEEIKSRDLIKYWRGEKVRHLPF